MSNTKKIILNYDVTTGFVESPVGFSLGFVPEHLVTYLEQEPTIESSKEPTIEPTKEPISEPVDITLQLVREGVSVEDIIKLKINGLI